MGGKAAALAEQGFRFDMGPTILIMPSVLERVFAEAKRKMSDYLQMVRLDPQWRCFFDDGTVLDLKHDVRDMRDSLNSSEPGMGDRYVEFMNLSEQLHGISDRFFFWRSIGSIRDTFDFGGAMNLAVLKDVMRMRLGQTVGGAIRSFIKDPAHRADARSLRAICRIGARRLPSYSLLHRTHAVPGGHLVPDGRHARRA